MKKILFVCTGNICRSPTAHAIARHKAKELGIDQNFIFDSAGINGFHGGETPDRRSKEVGKERGISFEGIYSRQIIYEDFKKFDLLLCMDRSHQRRLLEVSDAKYQEKIKLFLQFCEVQNPWNDEVIDPYYKAEQAFDQVFDVIDLALDNFFKK